jgi:hypothetical protein
MEYYGVKMMSIIAIFLQAIGAIWFGGSSNPYIFAMTWGIMCYCMSFTTIIQTQIVSNW